MSADAKAIHDALIPRVSRVPKPLPAHIQEKLEAQGVRVAKRQANVAARLATGKGVAVKGPAKGAAAKSPAPARSLANVAAPAEPAPRMVLDRSKAISVKELPDGTVVVKLTPNAAAQKIALDAHRGVGPKRGSPAFVEAIAAAMGPAADEALATIAKAAPDAKVRVMAGSTEMGVRNTAPSPSAPVRVAPVVASPASPAPAPVVVPSPSPAPVTPEASPASPPGKPEKPGKPT